VLRHLGVLQPLFRTPALAAALEAAARDNMARELALLAAPAPLPWE
jgi:hypothetical protein